ncbi:Potassium voltage-gated channel subfamily KQT member 1, partial [Frankliniella fusca]
LRTIRNVRSSSPRFGESHHPHYPHHYPHHHHHHHHHGRATPASRRRRDSRAAYRRANSEDACSDILGEDDEDPLGALAALDSTVLDVGEVAAGAPPPGLGHGDRHRGSVNSAAGAAGTGPAGGGGGRGHKAQSSGAAGAGGAGEAGGGGQRHSKPQGVPDPYYPIYLPIDQAFKAKYVFHHKRGKSFQERVYVFLEHPGGWLCFFYHFSV